MADIVSTPKVLGDVCWIATGITFGTDVEFEIKIDVVRQSNNYTLIFATNGNWIDCYRLYGMNSFLCAYSYQNKQSLTSGYNGLCVVKGDYQSFSLNGKKTAIDAATPKANNIFLFSGTTDEKTFVDPSTGSTLYYAKIWKSGTLVRDFIPVASGTTIGNKTLTEDALYDQVNKVLYYYGSTKTEAVDDTPTPSTVETPVITIATDGGVTLSCATSGATIYYTTNGTTPTASSTKYSAGFTVLDGTTVKAIAIKDGTSSEVASKTYSAPAVNAPTISIGTSGTVTISGDSGATIYYTTDGTTPTTSSTKYSSAFSVPSGTTVKAIAVRYGKTSSVSSQTYTASSVAAPTISISTAGVVTLSGASGASIYYTTNGSAPTTSSTKYASSFTVTHGVTVKAIAVLNGVTSSVASSTYTAPAVSTPTISISASGSVTISGDSGTTVYYTTNGSTPTTSSTKYTTSFAVADGTTVKAIAVRYGRSSSVATATYTKASVSAPVISITSAGVVTITCATSGAAIYYDTGGATPTTSSTKYSGSFTLSGTSALVCAVAYLDGTYSEVASQSWTKATVASPSISIDASGNVTIATNTSGATTYYTTNGTTPTSSSTKYTAKFAVSSGTTVKAVSIKDGVSSSVESLTYTKVEPVTGRILGRGFITIAAVNDGTSVTITSTSVTYQLCASGTTAPTGTWSTSIPLATDALPYLWTKTVVSYSDGKSTTSYSVSYKGKDGEGEQGKGALEVTVSPETLTFDTTDKGAAVIGSSNYATIVCYQDGEDVTSQCSSFAIVGKTNCAASVSGSKVTITAITSDDYTGASGETLHVSRTSGSVRVRFSFGGNAYYAEVRFTVNVNAYYSSLVSTQKEYTQKYGEITTALSGKASTSELTRVESSISQTAREIALTVSEKAVGRRNLLVGTAARRYGEGWEYVSGGAYLDGYPCEQIEINSGKDGTNCIHCRTKTSLSGFRWVGGSSQQGNVKLTKGKKYTLSFYARTPSPSSVDFVSECIWEGSATDSTRPGGYTGPTNFSKTYTLGSADTWTLCQVTLEVPSSASYEYVEVCIFAKAKSSTAMVEAYLCKPMLEEGDTYNGWTLSEQDYDYVGGNLLDNTRTLTVGGNLSLADGTVDASGYNGDSATLYRYMHALVARVASKTSLPTSASVGDCYACTDTWYVWQYTGTSITDNDHYKGYERIDEKLHNDIFTANLTLENGKDYIFSWYAKGTGGIGAYVGGESQTIFSEHSDGSLGTQSTYGEDAQTLTSEWRRFWMHVRPLSGTTWTVFIRQYRNEDNTASQCRISQPKLEEGATMTEYTERKTDLVEKTALLATGIDIESRKVTVTADTFRVQDNDGNQTLLVTQDGRLNSEIVTAKTLETVAADGTKITIKDGLMKFFNPSGVCNIKFGINDEGYSVLSYYDNEGKWLYDLGPNGLDAKTTRGSSLDSDTYVMASSFLGTSSFYQGKDYTVGSHTYTLQQVLSAYYSKLFGVNQYADESAEVANHSHVGYTPFSNASSVKLYRYTAAKQGSTYIKDTANGIPTAIAAADADGKYFTGTPSYNTSTLSFTNLASGIYFLKTATVMEAPYPMATADAGTFKYPAYVIQCVTLLNGKVVSPSMIYSTLERTVTMSL